MSPSKPEKQVPKVEEPEPGVVLITCEHCGKPLSKTSTYVCHLGSQAHAIEKAHAEGAIALSWHQTSTVETRWEVYLEEEDDSRPFNVKTDTEFQYINFDLEDGGLV